MDKIYAQASREKKSGGEDQINTHGAVSPQVVLNPPTPRRGRFRNQSQVTAMLHALITEGPNRGGGRASSEKHTPPGGNASTPWDFLFRRQTISSGRDQRTHALRLKRWRGAGTRATFGSLDYIWLIGTHVKFSPSGRVLRPT